MVDDEAKALKYFARALGNRFPVHSATSAAQALEILEARADEIGVIVTDQRMPESSGVDLLRVVRDQYPRTVRILTTAFTDQETLVGAINSGAVFSFVSKPWDPEELVRVLNRALQEYENRLRDDLVRGNLLEDWKTRLMEERAHEVGSIALKLGHYVNNALTPVAIMLDLMLEQPAKRPGAFSLPDLKRVRDRLHDISLTLRDLNDLSRPIAARDTRELNLSRLFRSALKRTQAVCEAKAITVEYVLPPAMPPVRGIPEQIEKLFRFMVAEEAVSLPANSLVKIRFSVQKEDGEALGVNIEFEDFVPPPPRFSGEAMLLPFTLRGGDPKEFGLFLSSCYFIARNHGGSLTARVKESGGLLYSIFLPVADARNTPGRSA